MTDTLPKTQHAVQFTGKKTAVVNPEMPVYPVGPNQLMVKVEACGICFSDIKLINAFDDHPRKSEVVRGLNPDQLAAIPSYKPGDMPVVPGHEPVGTIVQVGENVKSHKVGERVLIQTDYRHLPTAASNAAFGYNFDGALQEYTLMDEGVIVDPDDVSFLIPVSDKPSASAVALIEPWACVEAAYKWDERQTLREGGKLLIVLDEGREVNGVEELVAESKPGWTTTITSADIANVADEKFDDIIYFGTSGDVIEALEHRLAWNGILDVVLGGGSVDRKTMVDVGRVHYDLIRYTGTRGDDAAEGYRRIPAQPALRPADIVAIIGAAGPMGLMHTVLDVVSGTPDITVDAVDVDDARLARLEEVVAPLAIKHQVPTAFQNSKVTPLETGYTYVAVMVPAAPLVQQALDVAMPNAIVNAFAGFPIGTAVELDVDKMVGDGVYMVGTSGSRIDDMIAIKQKVDAGIVDTNVSLWAVTGMAGVKDALAAVENRTSGGKIMVYPELHDLGLVKLSEMREKFPIVADEMKDGVWTRAAEQMLMSEAK